MGNKLTLFNASLAESISITIPGEEEDLFKHRWTLLHALKQPYERLNSTQIIRRIQRLKTIDGDFLNTLVDSAGRSVLMLAIDRKLADVVEHVLYDEHIGWFDIDAQDNCYHWSAIKYAISKNQLSSVKKLLDKKCGINDKDIHGMNCLMQASMQGFYDIAKLLIENGANLNETCGNHHLTSLMLATRGGITVKEQWKGCFHVAELLIKHGADTEVISSSGKRAQDYCHDNEKRTQFQSLIRETWYDTPLHKAVHQNDMNTLDFLLQAGDIDVNVKGKYGWTALHTAVYCNRLEVAKKLLQNGAGSYTNIKGHTPLHLACQRGYTPMLSLLLEKEFSRGGCSTTSIEGKQV